MPASSHKLVTSDQAVPATGQHRKPCSDCPWARASMPGWLGGSSIDDWLSCVRSEARIECHTLTGAQCAGAAIFRANLCKVPRVKETLRLPADRETCFAHDGQFREHHGQRVVATTD